MKLETLPDHWETGGMKRGETRVTLRRCAKQLRETLEAEWTVPRDLAVEVVRWYSTPVDEREPASELLAQVAEALCREDR